MQRDIKQLALAAAAAILVLASGRSVRADQPSGVTAAPKRLAVEVNLGYQAPTGVGGASVVLTPTRWLSIAGGVGYEWGGLQLALTPRLHIAVGDNWTLGIGTGVSGGRYVWEETIFELESVKTWNRAIRANFELFAQRHWKWGLGLRLYAGVGRVLNDGDVDCNASGDPMHCLTDHRDDGLLSPYAGIALGHDLLSF